MRKPLDLSAEVQALRRKIDAVTEAAAQPLTAQAQRSLDRQLRQLILELEAALLRIDPVAMPASIFDPSNPKIIGRFTALALVAQTRRSLAEVGRFYGSGVYVIYYNGGFGPYAPISGSENPIYVGQAAPSTPGARAARDQGPRLSARLNEHLKNIRKATSTLDADEFEARYLVVQSGWETAAEDYLIHLFRPIWNNETAILYGLGKHGDSATTRANRRSPWDTLHPGRAWAVATMEDARSQERILEDLWNHFQRHPPVLNREAILEAFFKELRQA